MMKRQYILILLAAGLLAGCSKEPAGEVPDESPMVAVSFGSVGVQVVSPAGSAGAINAAGAKTARVSAASNSTVASGTRATGDIHHTFRLIVQRAGADMSSTPVAQNTYDVATAEGVGMNGTAVEAPVDAEGNYDAAGEAPDPILLAQTDYDFYFFAPALALSGSTFAGLKNGVDYKALKKTYAVTPNHADGKFHIRNVQLQRMASRIDFEVKFKAGSFGSSLEIDSSKEGFVKGLPSSATYTPGAAALTTSGTAGKMALPAELFTFSGTGSSTVLSTEDGSGIVVLPGSGLTLTVRLPLTIDGTAKQMQASLTDVTLEPGCKHLLSLTIDPFGNIDINISAIAWEDGGTYDEYWDEVPVRANSAMVVPGEKVIFDVADRVEKANTATPDLNLSWALDTEYVPLLIWQDVPELIPNSGLIYDKTKGRLTVTTNVYAGASGGNAVVGLFPSGTANTNEGNCIWSWHVWVTDYQPDGSKDYGLEANSYATVTGNGQVHTYGTQFMAKNPGKVIMDRNLGATKAYNEQVPAADDATADQSFGMFYQWGRKDPLPRWDGVETIDTAAKTIKIYGPTGQELPEGAKDNTTATGYKKVSVATAGTDAPATLQYSVKNPLTFIYNTGDKNDWYTANGTQNDNLWGNGAAKSVYDPCPEGWRIAPIGTWSDFGTAPYAPPFYYYINGVQQTAIGEPAFTRSGRNGRLYAAGSVKAWYPAPSYRYYASGALRYVGDDGYSWSSSVSGIRGMSLWFFSSNLEPSRHEYRANGLSVRCIQE